MAIFFYYIVKMNEEVFIARQPILNRMQSLFAYELLFRRRQGENHPASRCLNT